MQKSAEFGGWYWIFWQNECKKLIAPNYLCWLFSLHDYVDSQSVFLHLLDNLGQDSDALDAARLHDKVGEWGGEEGGELHLHGAQARLGAEVRNHQVRPHQEEARVDVIGPHLAQARHNTPPAVFFYNINTSVADPEDPYNFRPDSDPSIIKQ